MYVLTAESPYRRVQTTSYLIQIKPVPHVKVRCTL